MAKDFTDFLIVEYENISKAYFTSQENVSKWVRYYLLVLGIPLTLLSISLKDNGSIEKILEPISITIIIAGAIATALSLIIFDHRLDCTLYARTVNGVRKYFVENSGDDLNKDQALKYLILPTDPTKPSMKDCFGDTLVLKWLFISVNTFCIFFGLFLNNYLKHFWSYPEIRIIFLSITVIFLLFLQNNLYKKLSNNKDQKYKPAIDD